MRVQYGTVGALGAVYSAIGQPERNVGCGAHLRTRQLHPYTHPTMLVAALAMTGAGEQAQAAANGLFPPRQRSFNGP